MGEFYRQFFSTEKLIGNVGCDDSQRTYFWADIDQRTLETARAVAEGMFSDCNVEIRSLPQDQVDPLFDPIEAGLVKPDPGLSLAAVAGRIGPKLDSVVDANRSAFDTLNRILAGDGKPALSIHAQPVKLAPEPGGVTMSGPLRTASTLTENLLLEYTNGMSGKQFGWGRITTADLLQIMSLHTAYADLLRRTPYLARARGSNLLSFVLRSMEQQVAGKVAVANAAPKDSKLVFISGHDTNISNLSGMLGLSWMVSSYQRDDVPPGGALIFSLWQAGDTNRYYVRLQFLAQTMDQMHDASRLSLQSPPAIADVFIPGCGTAQEGYACEWPRFLQTAATAIDPAMVVQRR